MGEFEERIAEATASCDQGFEELGIPEPTDEQMLNCVNTKMSDEAAQAQLPTQQEGNLDEIREFCENEVRGASQGIAGIFRELSGNPELEQALSDLASTLEDAGIDEMGIQRCIDRESGRYRYNRYRGNFDPQNALEALQGLAETISEARGDDGTVTPNELEEASLGSSVLDAAEALRSAIDGLNRR